MRSQLAILFALIGVILPLALAGSVPEGAPRGHMQPLGFHKEPLTDIVYYDGWAPSKTFFKEHVAKAKPAYFRNACRDWPAFKKWTDKWLSENVGDWKADTEFRKIEDRSGKGKALAMSKYLKHYQSGDPKWPAYLISEIDSRLMPDASLPTGYKAAMEIIRHPNLWINSGITSSVLHNDGDDNINCVLDGTKVLWLADDTVGEDVYDSDKYYGYGSRSPVDPDAVDLIKWPRLSKVDYYNITVEAGDCVFFPHHWYHQVRSGSGRSMALNVWFAALREPEFLDAATDAEPVTFDEMEFAEDDLDMGDLDEDVLARLLLRDDIYRESLLESGSTSFTLPPWSDEPGYDAVKERKLYRKLVRESEGEEDEAGDDVDSFGAEEGDL